jgi:hypothetical protein
MDPVIHIGVEGRNCAADTEGSGSQQQVLGSWND